MPVCTLLLFSFRTLLLYSKELIPQPVLFVKSVHIFLLLEKLLLLCIFPNKVDKLFATPLILYNFSASYSLPSSLEPLNPRTLEPLETAAPHHCTTAALSFKQLFRSLRDAIPQPAGTRSGSKVPSPFRRQIPIFQRCPKGPSKAQS